MGCWIYYVQREAFRSSRSGYAGLGLLLLSNPPPTFLRVLGVARARAGPPWERGQEGEPKELRASKASFPSPSPSFFLSSGRCFILICKEPQRGSYLAVVRDRGGPLKAVYLPAVDESA